MCLIKTIFSVITRLNIQAFTVLSEYCLSISAIFHMHKIIRYFMTNSKLIVNNLQSVINNSVVRRYLLNKKKFIVIQLSLVYLNEVPFTFSSHKGYTDADRSPPYDLISYLVSGIALYLCTIKH